MSVLLAQLKEQFYKVLRSIYKNQKVKNIVKNTVVAKLAYPVASKLIQADEKLEVEVDGQIFHLKWEPKVKDIAWSIYQKGVHEDGVTKLFCSLVKKDMVVVDVGAGIGYYTLLAAKRVGGKGVVLAFEPSPQNFTVLKDNVNVNSWENVKAYNLAISDLEEVNTLRVPIAGKVRSTFANRDLGLVKEIKVKSIQLDNVPQAENADIVKIDVEGAEIMVLKGMKQLLGKGKVKVICEVHPPLINSLGFELSELEEILTYYGYKIYLINDYGELHQIDKLSRESRAHYLFSKEDAYG